jgi:hypothetical protein
MKETVMRIRYLLIALSMLLAITLVSEQAMAQKRPKKSKTKEASAAKERKSKGDTESMTLDKIDIVFRVQTPKVKLSIERMPLDVKTEHDRFGDISKEVEVRGQRALYNNRVYEKPIYVSPRDVANRERQ